MCRVDDVSRRRAVRRQTAFNECEPRAWAHAGSRAGSFRVLAGPGTTAGRPLVSRASSLASLAFCVCDAGWCGKVTKNLGLPCCASASNVPSVSHCRWTWASSFNKASRRVLDFGGAGGVAMVSRASQCLAVLSVCCCLLAVQRSRSDWRAVSGYRCASRPRAVSQTAIYARKRCKHADFCASLAIKLAVRH